MLRAKRENTTRLLRTEAELMEQNFILKDALSLTRVNKILDLLEPVFLNRLLKETYGNMSGSPILQGKTNLSRLGYCFRSLVAARHPWTAVLNFGSHWQGAIS